MPLQQQDSTKVALIVMQQVMTQLYGLQYLYYEHNFVCL